MVSCAVLGLLVLMKVFVVIFLFLLLKKPLEWVSPVIPMLPMKVTTATIITIIIIIIFIIIANRFPRITCPDSSWTSSGRQQQQGE